MKKCIGKIMGVILTSALAVSFTGCSSKDDSKNSDAQSTKAAETEKNITSAVFDQILSQEGSLTYKEKRQQSGEEYNGLTISEIEGKGFEYTGFSSGGDVLSIFFENSDNERIDAVLLEGEEGGAAMDDYEWGGDGYAYITERYSDIKLSKCEFYDGVGNYGYYDLAVVDNMIERGVYTELTGFEEKVLNEICEYDDCEISYYTDIEDDYKYLTKKVCIVTYNGISDNFGYTIYCLLDSSADEKVKSVEAGEDDDIDEAIGSENSMAERFLNGEDDDIDEAIAEALMDCTIEKCYGLKLE